VRTVLSPLPDYDANIIYGKAARGGRKGVIMDTTTNNHWLTNVAAVCVIIFSLTGSAMFIAALIHMQKPTAASKILMPTQQEIIRSEPLVNTKPIVPMLGDTLRPQRMPEIHENFDRAKIMASYKAMHSIYN
jgi:hypothetical protein